MSITISHFPGQSPSNLLPRGGYLPSAVHGTTSCEKLNHCLPPQNSSAALRKTRCLSCRFSDFYSIAARRSLCTTFVTNYCGQHQRCLVHGRRISKYKYICFCYPSSMDRCCASARSLRFLLWWCISTAAWRLLVQTCCQKSEKRQQTTQTMLGRQICKGRNR